MTMPDNTVDPSVLREFEERSQGAFVEEDEPWDSRMTINMGPQHPSTHGVLRLVLELEGEIVRDVRPVIGYLHTGMEKECEDSTWRQAVTIVTRMDYLAPFFNELVYSLATEKLLGVEIPPRGQAIRILMTELNRISSHLVWMATQGMDMGAVSMMTYGFRERELLIDFFEMVTGLRMNHNYIMPGGVWQDLPDGWRTAVGDLVARHRGRRDEMRRSMRIARQVLDTMPEGDFKNMDPKITPPPRAELTRSMEAVIHHFKLVTQGYAVPPGDAYTSVESPRGELGAYVVSNGETLPYRVHVRDPSFANLQSLPTMMCDTLVADTVAAIASGDPVLGGADR